MRNSRHQVRRHGITVRRRHRDHLSKRRSDLEVLRRPHPGSHALWWALKRYPSRRRPRETLMNLSRRNLVAAGALALSAPAVIRSAHAESADEATVRKAVEELRMAWFKQDKAELEALTAEQLSYSHSDAHLEDKGQIHQRGDGPKGYLQVARMARTHGPGRREQCRRATSLGLGKRARRQSHQ